MSIKELLEKAKKQGYVSYLDFRDSLPGELVDEGQIEELLEMINDLGIEVRVTKAEIIELFPNKK